MSDAEKEKGSILEVLSQWLLVPIAVFSYYSANRSYFEWLNPLPTLALGLAGMALIHLVLGRFQKDRTKTALICTLLGMAFFFPLPVVDLLVSHASKSLYRIAAQWGSIVIIPLLTITLVLKTVRARKLHRDIAKTVSISLIFLLIPSLISWVGSIRIKSDADAAKEAGQGGKEEQLPDFFYIIPDTYPRADVLRSHFNYDNSSFLDELRKEGFLVATNSHSNYPQTALSVASSLNLQYLHDLIQDPGNQNRQVLYDLIHTNRTAELLGTHHYEIAHVETGYKATAPMALTTHEVRLVQKGLFQNEFLSLFLKRTLLRPLLKSYLNNAFDNQHRRRITSGLEQISRFASDNKPTFVFAHLVCPHPPLVFASEEIRRKTSSGTIFGIEVLMRNPEVNEEILKRGYVEQIQGFNPVLLQAVRSIREKATRPYVILIQADHGTSLKSRLDRSIEEPNDFRERFSILLAVSASNALKDRFHGNITPVNACRNILSEITGQDFPPLEDRRYYASWWDPFIWKDVTPLTGQDMETSKTGSSQATGE